MKEGVESKLKFRKLKRRLGFPEWQIIGLLESIWKLCRTSAQEGDIGRFSNADIADSIEYDGNADDLVAALVECGWIDEDPEFRLIIHDWSEHVPNYLKGNFSKHNRQFADEVAKQRAKQVAKQPANDSAKHGANDSAKHGAKHVLPSLAKPSQVQTSQAERSQTANNSVTKTDYVPGPDIVIPPRLNHPEIIDALGSWIRHINKLDPEHRIWPNSDEEAALYRMVNSWQVSTAGIVTRILECVGNRWRTLRAPDAPFHQTASFTAATDLEDTWDALTTFIGKIPPGETYTDRITAKFGSKVAALVKKFGYNEIKTANDFEDSRLKKRFVREMQS